MTSSSKKRRQSHKVESDKNNLLDTNFKNYQYNHQDNASLRKISKNNNNEGYYYLPIHPVICSIFVLSFAIRYYKLEYPNAVVFDELHYIKFITLYLKRVFFFDSQPPFGKQLIALTAYICGFEGNLSYSQIGDVYSQDTRIGLLRLLPCICGSLVPVVAYLIGLELKFRQLSSSLIALLLIFDNSLVTQSKFILLDSPAILFTLLSLYFYLKFKNESQNTCPVRKPLYLILAAINSSLAISIKYSSLLSYSLLLFLSTKNLWQQVKSEKNTTKLIKNAIFIFVTVIILPILFYLFSYYIHLAWLTKAGPHDNIMTSAFQASLENGLASITRGQPLEIVHGSQITLRHTHGRSCWLHSHDHLYPIKYADNTRGSSHQQQVTCYSFKDVNNWWIVKRPHLNDLVANTNHHDKIKDGDSIQLIHGLTGRSLNSHDVASPMSPYSQEVSCYVDHNVSMPAQDIWKVRLLNPSDTNSHWHTLNSRIQLIHSNSTRLLRFSGRQLPDWGFHQHEIVADKESKSDDSVWNVEEHRLTKSEDKQVRDQELGKAEFVPLEPTSLSFTDKFIEIHQKLLDYQSDVIKDHIYACESPLDWILMRKGTAYWVSAAGDNKTSQIFLVGNIYAWTLGLLSLCTLSAILIFYLLRRRRNIKDVEEKVWNKFSFASIVLFTGYLVNFIPYFLYESPLFLQFYMNALIFKLISIGMLFDHLIDLQSHRIVKALFAITILVCTVYSFIFWSPFIYGTKLSRKQVEERKWTDSWQLLTL